MEDFNLGQFSFSGQGSERSNLTSFFSPLGG